MIARAMVHQPRLLILDEPTAGVDIEIRRSMWQMMEEVNRQGTTIILTTHYLEEAESLCRNIAIINHGQIIEKSTMQNLLSRIQTEHFVLDIDQALTVAPIVNGYSIELVDSHSINVAVEKTHGLNPLFQELSEQGIKVLSLKNKSNRLEQLFIDLVQ
jgi:ABC-2 type transport system ATP-binding protein